MWKLQARDTAAVGGTRGEGIANKVLSSLRTEAQACGACEAIPRLRRAHFIGRGLLRQLVLDNVGNDSSQ